MPEVRVEWVRYVLVTRAFCVRVADPTAIVSLMLTNPCMHFGLRFFLFLLIGRNFQKINCQLHNVTSYLFLGSWWTQMSKHLSSLREIP